MRKPVEALHAHKMRKTIPSVTILGSGTCAPSLERSASSILVEMPMDKLLFDLGLGTMRRLLENQTDWADITHICISHFHPDHTGELASFLFSAKYSPVSQRKKPLTLIGGQGTSAFFRQLKTVYPGWIDLGPDLFQIMEVNRSKENVFQFKTFNLRSMPVAHNPESIAWRVEDASGKTIVYSGDTDYCDALVEIASKADVFVCECAFLDEMKKPGHLTPALAGKIAAKAQVRQLVLTHFYPPFDMAKIMEQCRKTYKGPLVLAHDLMKINFGIESG